MTVDLKTSCEWVLAWWELRCISSEDVIAWADGAISNSAEAGAPPQWLVDLSVRGPRDFRASTDRDGPRPRRLTYVERFRAMVECTRPGDDEAVHRFAVWVADAAMGEDLALREVRVGYEVKHAFGYADSGDPIEIARDAIATFRPRCQEIGRFFRTARSG
jgi:hypothetical protein